MHLWVLLGSAFLASGTFFIQDSGVISAFPAAIVFILLFAMCAVVIMPGSMQEPLKHVVRQWWQARLLNAAWDSLAHDSDIKYAFATASREGHLEQFQRQMAQHCIDEMTIGQVWTALELSRVNAGLKPYPEQSVFRKKNIMRA